MAKDDEKVLKMLAALADKWLIVEEKRVPLIKRGQVMNFIIMLIIMLGVIFLAYNSKIDGSAATGLIGAVIGYVFGSLYNRDKK